MNGWRGLWLHALDVSRRNAVHRARARSLLWPSRDRAGAGGMEFDVWRRFDREWLTPACWWLRQAWWLGLANMFATPMTALLLVPSLGSVPSEVLLGAVVVWLWLALAVLHWADRLARAETDVRGVLRFLWSVRLRTGQEPSAAEAEALRPWARDPLSRWFLRNTLRHMTAVARRT